MDCYVLSEKQVEFVTKASINYRSIGNTVKRRNEGVKNYRSTRRRRPSLIIQLTDCHIKLMALQLAC